MKMLPRGRRSENETGEENDNNVDGNVQSSFSGDFDDIDLRENTSSDAVLASSPHPTFSAQFISPISSGPISSSANAYAPQASRSPSSRDPAPVLNGWAYSMDNNTSLPPRPPFLHSSGPSSSSAVPPNNNDRVQTTPFGVPEGSGSSLSFSHSSATVPTVSVFNAPIVVEGMPIPSSPPSSSSSSINNSNNANRSNASGSLSPPFYVKGRRDYVNEIGDSTASPLPVIYGNTLNGRGGLFAEERRGMGSDKYNSNSSFTIRKGMIRSISTDNMKEMERKTNYPSTAASFHTRRRAFSFSELERQQREEQMAMHMQRRWYVEDDRYLAVLPYFDRNTTIAMMKKSKEKGGERPRWKSKTEYLLTLIGYAVGLGNFWRFPYLCYENGGGVFLIPYFLCLLLLGIPMFMMEVSVGQRMQMGYLRVWRSISARLTGIGMSSVILALLCSVYYNVIIAWTLFYLFNSFQSPLPWASGGLNYADSAKKFFFQNCLHKAASMSGGLPDGAAYAFNWRLLICLTLAWLMVYFSVWKGISNNGKVVYFTAIYPFIGLFILLIRGVTLEGAGKGISFYLAPDWSKLAYVRVWATAGSQIFYSLGIAWGSLVNFASFNPTRNNFFLDTYIVTGVNALTSLLAGFVVFSVVGYMSEQTGLPVGEVAKAGSGLAFVVYPAGLANMTGSVIFSILFFLILLCLGIDSEFAMVEVVITCIIEASFFKNVKKEYVAAVICVIMWLVGWLFISPVGSYYIDLMDTFTGSVALYVVALCEVFAVVWIYGIDRFSNDIQKMTGKNMRIFKVIYKYVVPTSLLLLIVFGIYMFAIPEQGNQHFVETKRGIEGNGCPGEIACGGHGACKHSMCMCQDGFGGMDCSIEGEYKNGKKWCPEDCNGGRGRCDTKTGICTCMSEYEGPSCMGNKYAMGWPGWGIALGWLFALGSLLPIPLLAVVKTLRRKVKRGIDEQGVHANSSTQCHGTEMGTAGGIGEVELPPVFVSSPVDNLGVVDRHMNSRTADNNARQNSSDNNNHDDSDPSSDDLQIYGTDWKLSNLLHFKKKKNKKKQATGGEEREGGGEQKRIVPGGTAAGAMIKQVRNKFRWKGGRSKHRVGSEPLEDAGGADMNDDTPPRTNRENLQHGNMYSINSGGIGDDNYIFNDNHGGEHDLRINGGGNDESNNVRNSNNNSTGRT